MFHNVHVYLLKNSPGHIELRPEFDPKKFLGQVPQADSSGVPFAAWKRRVMAKQLAEQAQREHDRLNTVRTRTLQSN